MNSQTTEISLAHMLLEREEEWNVKILEEIMAKMLPNLMNTVNPQMQEAQWIPVSKKTTPQTNWIAQN